MVGLKPCPSCACMWSCFSCHAIAICGICLVLLIGWGFTSVTHSFHYDQHDFCITILLKYGSERLAEKKEILQWDVSGPFYGVLVFNQSTKSNCIEGYIMLLELLYFWWSSWCSLQIEESFPLCFYITHL